MTRPNTIEQIVIARRNKLIQKLLKDGIPAVTVSRILKVDETIISKLKK